MELNILSDGFRNFEVYPKTPKSSDMSDVFFNRRWSDMSHGALGNVIECTKIKVYARCGVTFFGIHCNS